MRWEREKKDDCKIQLLSLFAGYSYDPDCMYVNGTGRDYYEFYIQLNRCGTLGENTHHQDSRKNPTVGEVVMTTLRYQVSRINTKQYIYIDDEVVNFVRDFN